MVESVSGTESRGRGGMLLAAGAKSTAISRSVMVDFTARPSRSGACSRTALAQARQVDRGALFRAADAPLRRVHWPPLGPIRLSSLIARVACQICRTGVSHRVSMTRVSAKTSATQVMRSPAV